MIYTIANVSSELTNNYPETVWLRSGDTTYSMYGRFGECFSLLDMKKWLAAAKAMTEIESPCLSRQIGVVIADPRTGSQVSSGHNGPPDETPACDNEDYLKNVVWPQLTGEEKLVALRDENGGAKLTVDNFVGRHADCGQCPRRIVGAASGQRLELCTCAHGETNAIVRAHRSVAGCWMFCWCSIPCIECSKLILNSKIRVVVALEQPDPKKDYSPYSSRWPPYH